LQIIAGTVMPSTGHVEVNGRVVALLELGSGFNPEFTGRENVYLNGAMFGISRKDMDKKFPVIEAFADIGEYMEQPVKTYSSGMFARLAFAVAINMDPDILIVDEILAVGDIAFQAKCVAKLRKMKDEGLTLLFVSHSVDALKSLCNEAVLLEKGNLLLIGTSEEVTNRYLASIREEINAQHNKQDELDINDSAYGNLSSSQFRYGPGEVFFESVQMIDGESNIVRAYEYGQTARLRCTIQAKKDMKNINVSFLVRDITGVDLFGSTMFDERIELINLKESEKAIIDFAFPIALRAGSYSVSVAVNTVSSRDYSDVYLFEQIDAATAFEVIGNPLRPVHYKFHLPITISHSGQGERKWRTNRYLIMKNGGKNMVENGEIL
jgi:lipopolysaccharide transport system ATP-binding protein